MKAPGGNRNVRWVILHGYSPPVNHSHLKGSSEGNTDNWRKGRKRKGKEGEKESWCWFKTTFYLQFMFGRWFIYRLFLQWKNRNLHTRPFVVLFPEQSGQVFLCKYTQRFFLFVSNFLLSLIYPFYNCLSIPSSLFKPFNLKEDISFFYRYF